MPLIRQVLKIDYFKPPCHLLKPRVVLERTTVSFVEIEYDFVGLVVISIVSMGRAVVIGYQFGGIAVFSLIKCVEVQLGLDRFFIFVSLRLMRLQ